MTESPDASLIKLAVAKGLLTQDLAKEVFHQARDEHRSVDELLVSRGLMTSYNLDLLRKEQSKAQAPRIIGGCEIKSKLGQGGMGAVYRAVQLSIGREVALKVLAPEVARKPGFAERFLREGKAMGAISHPNVITCYDAGPDGKVLYMALELMTGGDADQAAKRQGGRLPPLRACEIVRDAAAGLGAIAKAGLIHRDIKPANIFLGEDGIAKLADLGLARQEDGEDQMTRTGTAMGTPAFMSPEQAKGEDLDIRSDIYALGATLFALITGQPPFVGASAFAIVAKVINDPVPDPRGLNPDLPEPVVAMVRRTMAKDRRKRPQTPGELQQELNTCLDQLRRSGQGQTVSTAGVPTHGHSSPTPLTIAPGASGSRHAIRHSGSTTVSIPRNWLIIGATLTVTVIASLAILAVSRSSTAPVANPAASVPPPVAPVVQTPPPAPVSKAAPPVAPTPAVLKVGDPWPDFAEWAKRTRGLPADGQIAAMTTALHQLNPRANGAISPRFDVTMRKVPTLELDGIDLTDLRPLAGLNGLHELSLSGGTPQQAIPLYDLGTLEGLKLRTLRIPYAMVSDVTPLARMQLIDVDVTGCRIRDLRPLLNSELRQLAFHPASAESGIDRLRQLADVQKLGSTWADLQIPAEFWLLYDQGGFPGSRPPAETPSQAATGEAGKTPTEPAKVPTIGIRPLMIPDSCSHRTRILARAFNEIVSIHLGLLAQRRREAGKKPIEVVDREIAQIPSDPAQDARRAALREVRNGLELGFSPQHPSFTVPGLPASVEKALATWRDTCTPIENDFLSQGEVKRNKCLNEMNSLANEQRPGASELAAQLTAMALPNPPSEWINTPLANGDFGHLNGNRPTDWNGRMDGITVPSEGDNHWLRLEWPAIGRDPRALRQTMRIDPQWRAVLLSAKVRIPRKPEAPVVKGGYGGVSLIFEDPTGKLPAIRRNLDWPGIPAPQTWITLGGKDGKDSQVIPAGYTLLTVECLLYGFIGSLDIDDVQLKAQIRR